MKDKSKCKMLLYKYIQRVILVVVKMSMTNANKHKIRKKFIYISAQFIKKYIQDIMRVKKKYINK